MRVIATAGHVDHGKSSLVLAITGTDPDRLAEEKERGLTIDLGFAFAELPSGETLGFIDVPGHKRFVKNMLAGVGSIDIALLVVAANEGWMPQTAEHVAILDLLDVPYGVVALTKADLVDTDTLDLARLEIADRVAATRLATWPVVPVDSRSGRGVDDVVVALDAVIQDAPPAADRGRPRLWVDRVFAAKGSGTIVTGTLVGGALHVDDEVRIEPHARAARVRAIESHGHRHDQIGPGARVALNLSGIDHHEVRRGDAIVKPDQFAVVATVDAHVQMLDNAALPRGAVTVHVGSGEHRARIRMLDEASQFARLQLDDALPFAPGDRLVLRSTGAQTTVGGAQVLDVLPARRTTDARARLALPLGARVMAACPWATDQELHRLGGPELSADDLVRDRIAVRIGEWLVSPAEVERVRELTVEAVRRATSESPGADLATTAALCAVDTARLRAALQGETRVVVERDLIRDASAAAVTQDPAAIAFIDALAARPFDPPSPGELDVSPAVVRALVSAGAVVMLDGIAFDSAALDQARRIVAKTVARGNALTVSAARELLGTTRKYAVPMLTRFDAEGITRRRGDERIAGPRAADWA